MPGEGKRTGSQPASAMYSGRLGQAPAGLSFIYLSAMSWEVRREEMAEASLYQRGLAGSWGIGNIIGLLSLLAMAPIRHFSLPHPPTLLADIAEEMRQCWPFRPWAGTIPNKTCHLCLQWHLFDRRRFFLPPSLSPLLCILPLPFSLAWAVLLETWMQLGWCYPWLLLCKANDFAVRDRPPVSDRVGAELPEQV